MIFNHFHEILNIVNFKFENMKMSKNVLASFQIAHCVRIVMRARSIIIFINQREIRHALIVHLIRRSRNYQF